MSGKPEEKTFVCPGCQKGNFKSLYAVRVHFEAKGHPLKCVPCDQSFDALKILLNHCMGHAKLPDSAPKRLQKQDQGPPKSQSKPVDALPSRKSKKGQQIQSSEIIPTQAPGHTQQQEQSVDDSKLQPAKQVEPKPRKSKKGQQIQSSEIIPTQAPGHTRQQEQSVDDSKLQPAKQVEPKPRKAKKPKQVQNQETHEIPVTLPGKPANKYAPNFIKGQDLFSVKPVESTKPAPVDAQTRPQKLGKGKDRSKTNKPVEILARAQPAQPAQPQPPLRFFSGDPKSRGDPSFAFGDTLLDTSQREREAARLSIQAAQNENYRTSQNENYHVTLEPLEQNLIFRYLLARCHSDTRLAKHGYTFQPSLNEAHKRPSKQCPIKRGLFREVPRWSSDNLAKRRAIVLDCEMVQVEEGRRELAFLSAIDFLTGEVLIDNYVQPKARVVNWDSRFSGVTPGAMNKAVRNGTALMGWESARAKLWSFMNSDTVLIGHSLNNDLDVLGMIHWNIVDSSIMTSEAVFLQLHSGEQLTRTWGLKTLALELVNYDIQVGKQGHSALEDAHATRDVVIWCIRYPELLKVWADNAREEVAMRVLEREKRTTDREQLEDQRRLEMEYRVQALSQGLSGMTVAASVAESVEESDDDPVPTVRTGYVRAQAVEFF